MIQISLTNINDQRAVWGITKIRRNYSQAAHLKINTVSRSHTRYLETKECNQAHNTLDLDKRH